MDWRLQAGSSVFVLGGTGFVGRQLVKVLSEAGIFVRTVSRSKSACALGAKYVSVIRGNLLNEQFAFDQHLSGCSVIFNCMGELKDESLMQALHVDATVRMLRSCRKFAEETGQRLHWVQLSSVGAYGPPSGQASSLRAVTEATPLSPRGAYEITKARADELIIEAGEQGYITYTILRPSNVFGPVMPNDSLRQLIGIIRSGRFFYIGNMDTVVTYVHVDDVVAALLQCGFRRAAINQVFDISNDVPLRHLVESVAAHFSIAPPALRIPELPARLLCSLFSWFKGFPLTQGRIDALVARTSYPNEKLGKRLGVTPTKSILTHFSDVFFDE